LPDTEEDADLTSELATRFALNIIDVKKIADLKHAFSHFHLFIRATAIKTVFARDVMLNENNGQWFFAHQLSKLGLARPVTKIIHCFLGSG